MWKAGRFCSMLLQYVILVCFWWLSRCCYAVVGPAYASDRSALFNTHDFADSNRLMRFSERRVCLALNASMHFIIRAHCEGLLQTSGFRRCNHTPAPAVAGPLSACPSAGVNIGGVY